MTRTFVPQEIPKEEIRSKEVTICASLRAAVSTDSSKIMIAETVESVAHYSNSICTEHLAAYANWVWLARCFDSRLPAASFE